MRNKYALFLMSIFLLFSVQVVDAQTKSKRYRLIAVSAADEELRSVSNEVEITPPLQIQLPTAFSPNGDGLNDTFGVNSMAVSSMKLRIFNRWGELVFESDSPSARWDGYYGGKKAPGGVYAYELTAKGYDGESMVKKGSVSLIN